MSSVLSSDGVMAVPVCVKCPCPHGGRLDDPLNCSTLFPSDRFLLVPDRIVPVSDKFLLVLNSLLKVLIDFFWYLFDWYML